jgi:hypothetical protein
MITLGRTIVAAAWGLMLLSGPAKAVPIGISGFSGSESVIDFDSLTGGVVGAGDVSTAQFTGQGVTFNNPDFDTRANMDEAALLSTNSGPNVALVEQGGGSSGPNVPPQELIFSVPVKRVGAVLGDPSSPM